MRHIALGFTLLLGAPIALAAPVVGEGEGYYGSVWYEDNTGRTIMEQSYALCAERLDYWIDHDVNQDNKVIDWLKPCAWRPAYGVAGPVFEVGSEGGQGSLDEAEEVMFRYSTLRRMHDMDGFDAELRRMAGDGS